MKLEEIEKAMATIIECHHESNRNIQALYDALVETIRADGKTGLVKDDNKAHHEAEERINHEKTVNKEFRKEQLGVECFIKGNLEKGFVLWIKKKLSKEESMSKED